MIVIRQFRDTDYHSLIQLWRDSGIGLTLSDIEEEIRVFARVNPSSFFVMTDVEKIIGSVIATFDGRRGYIYHLAVHPSRQRKGYGQKLMQHAENYFRSINVVKIHLMVDRHNSAVVPFYDKIGWQEREDIIVMSKSLRSDEIFVKDDRVEII
ncbi:MAG: GNAT family N-acetyltransferase [Candidatus Kariarchaeaceae archaeon]|jgi:ribosomal protein S18 acetylase RimI-like enzyme